MLHHLSLGVTDIQASAAFYDSALLPLGYVRVWSDIRPGEAGQAVGYGLPGDGDKLALKQVAQPIGTNHPGFHLAFAAASRTAVVEFHTAAVVAGGTSAGAPGLREHYGPSYFAAFVVDLDGHRLEAVCKTAA